jgi:hypothetical protein
MPQGGTGMVMCASVCGDAETWVGHGEERGGEGKRKGTGWLRGQVVVENMGYE